MGGGRVRRRNGRADGGSSCAAGACHSLGCEDREPQATELTRRIALKHAHTQAAAAFLTWLRVAAGYHTVPQVAVGGLAGAAAGAAWLALAQWALPAMASDANRGALQALYGLTVAASVLFVAKFAKRWRKEVAKLAPEAAA